MRKLIIILFPSAIILLGDKALTPMAQSNYAILATNDGSGNYTLTVSRGATLSGGTSLPGGGADLASSITTTSVGTAIEVGKLIAQNDRAAGN